MTVIAGTGSRRFRPEAFRGWEQLVQQSLLLHEEPLTIMSGMAEGWDEHLALFARDNALNLHAAVPKSSYGAHYWGKASVTGRNRFSEYAELLDYAKEFGQVTSVCPETTPSADANLRRNRFMVEEADAFLVLSPDLDGTISRGTNHCYNLILASGKPYVMIDHNEDGLAFVSKERS